MAFPKSFGENLDHHPPWEIVGHRQADNLTLEMHARGVNLLWFDLPFVSRPDMQQKIAVTARTNGLHQANIIAISK